MLNGAHLSAEGLLIIVDVSFDGLQFFCSNGLERVSQDLEPLINLDDRVLLHLGIVNQNNVVCLLVVLLHVQVSVVLEY